jgi:hypothetical protein
MRNKKILAVVLVCALAIGCNTLASIQKWEPVALQAFSYIISILQSNGVITAGTQSALATDAAAANADFGDLASDITAAQASSALATGSLNKTIAVLGSLQKDLGQIITDTHLPAKDQTAVSEGLQGLIVVLASFQTQLTPVAAGRAKLSSVKAPDLAGFKARFNLTMVTAGHPDKILR